MLCPVWLLSTACHCLQKSRPPSHSCSVACHAAIPTTAEQFLCDPLQSGIVSPVSSQQHVLSAAKQPSHSCKMSSCGGSPTFPRNNLLFPACAIWPEVSSAVPSPLYILLAIHLHSACNPNTSHLTHALYRPPIPCDMPSLHTQLVSAAGLAVNHQPVALHESNCRMVWDGQHSGCSTGSQG